MCSGCWGPTAPARRRSCESSWTSSVPTPGASRSSASRSAGSTSIVSATSRRSGASIRKQNVLDVMTYFGALKGLPRAEARKRARLWLDRIELPHVAAWRVERLSKGMRQKVQIASTLLADPELCVLDEPSTGLDPLNVRLVADLIREREAQRPHDDSLDASDEPGRIALRSRGPDRPRGAHGLRRGERGPQTLLAPRSARPARGSPARSSPASRRSEREGDSTLASPARCGDTIPRRCWLDARGRRGAGGPVRDGARAHGGHLRARRAGEGAHERCGGRSGTIATFEFL